MQKEWSSFRITLLLYSIVFILPFSFYFVYSSFKTMQNDTKTGYLINWAGGAIEHLAIVPSGQNTIQMVIRIDDTFQKISSWVIQNEDSDLYIGAATLATDFSTVQSCWNDYKQKLSQHNEETIREYALHCYSLVADLAIIIEKMVYLKQNKMINIFYFSLAVAMLLALLMIYLVRVYIHIQMKKHAIYDPETRLFNRKYLLSELKTTCSRSIRYKYPLSLLSITIADLAETDHTYDKKTKKHILKIFGGLMISLTRASDVACRFDENSFYIILPFTTEKDALIMKERIRDALEKHDFMIDKKLDFIFSTTQFDNKETLEAFIIRIQDLLIR